MPKYPLPNPRYFALLAKAHALQHPSQQLFLAAYAAGEIGIETTAVRLLADVKERYPAARAAYDADAPERAIRARVQREMIENRTAAGPTFYDCDRDGRRLDAVEQAPALKPAARAQPANAALTGATAPDENSDSEGDAPYQPGPGKERDIDFDE